MASEPHSISPGSLLALVRTLLHRKRPGLAALAGVTLLVSLPIFMAAREFMAPDAPLSDRLAVMLLILTFAAAVGMVGWMWRSLLSRVRRDTPSSWEDWK